MLKNGYPLKNRLLAALPADVQINLFPDLELVELPLDHVIHEPLGKLKYAYFPLTCIISKLGSLESGSTAEIAAIGNEGMVSVCLFMGGESMPHQTVISHPGMACRIKSEVIKQEFFRSISVQHTFLRYTQALLTQMAQAAVCNRHHFLEQRFCHYLLTSLDRLSSNDINITQERIANMLGVRREGVTEVARRLQESGLINYSRGHIEIIDREGLESATCECYNVVRTEFDRLMPIASPASATPYSVNIHVGDRNRAIPTTPSRVR